MVSASGLQIRKSAGAVSKVGSRQDVQWAHSEFSAVLQSNRWLEFAIPTSVLLAFAMLFIVLKKDCKSMVEASGLQIRKSAATVTLH